MAYGCLDEASLVVKDIVVEICGDERPAKRIKRHARTSQLRELIDASSDAGAHLSLLGRSKPNTRGPSCAAAIPIGKLR